MSSRTFYALTREQQHAFRRAVSAMRDGCASEAVQQAFAALDVGHNVIDRRVTIVVYASVEERLALVPPGEREPIAAALLGGCPGAQPTASSSTRPACSSWRSPSSRRSP
ncbi:hypothetical protein BV511_16155 [Methylorubrum extorquens]|uniref:hypothetical protein n=1 Tax=Methylorubrum extorquens TaxID=408 RepID=UPI000972C25D|nr:hypothetical protein [Methylorubrum extorquens]APX86090.1 hypothetical protein BV511_16155 [Methylorubrum extorquens]